MPDILHDFPIRASRAAVFDAVARPEGLDRWWTLRAAGRPERGSTYELFFGEPYDWRAEVSACVPGEVFELRLTRADDEWTGTTVRFELEERDGMTHVRFAHRGWPAETAHYRTSSFCWAMYLRLLRRALEVGETVAYDRRLEA